MDVPDGVDVLRGGDADSDVGRAGRGERRDGRHGALVPARGDDAPGVRGAALGEGGVVVAVPEEDRAVGAAGDEPASGGAVARAEPSHRRHLVAVALERPRDRRLRGVVHRDGGVRAEGVEPSAGARLVVPARAVHGAVAPDADVLKLDRRVGAAEARGGTARVQGRERRLDFAPLRGGGALAAVGGRHVARRAAAPTPGGGSARTTKMVEARAKPLEGSGAGLGVARPRSDRSTTSATSPCQLCAWLFPRKRGVESSAANPNLRVQKKSAPAIRFHPMAASSSCPPQSSSSSHRARYIAIKCSGARAALPRISSSPPRTPAGHGDDGVGAPRAAPDRLGVRAGFPPARDRARVPRQGRGGTSRGGGDGVSRGHAARGAVRRVRASRFAPGPPPLASPPPPPNPAPAVAHSDPRAPPADPPPSPGMDRAGTRRTARVSRSPRRRSCSCARSFGPRCSRSAWTTSRRTTAGRSC